MTMAIINRASLPEEFFDITSSMVLVQPEPQYVFAQLAKMALGSAMLLAAAGALGISPTRQIADTGQQYTLPGADRLNLAQPDPQVSNMILSVAELSIPQIGHTIRINRPRYGSGGFTLANREIPSGTQISTTPIDLQSEQVTVTLKRYGGPYDPANNNVAPFALDRFDSSRSVHSIAQIVGLHMQRDFDKWADIVTAAFLSAGTTTLWPTGFTADNNSQIAGDMPMDIDVLFRGYETLKNANIPMFPNGRYRAFISPTQARQLKNDAQLAGYNRYDTSGLNPVTAPGGNPNAGYLFSFTGCDVYEATTLSATNNAQSIPVTTGIMGGPGMMALGAGALPYVTSSTDDNYGESAKVIWLSYLGWNLSDARFGVQMHTS
jgi:hypothetical protein